MKVKNRVILFIVPLLFWFIVGPGFVKAEDIPIPEPDLVAPVITLIGETSLVLNLGDVYVDAGATAVDNIDGDITASIITANLVDTAIAGDYTVTYTVTDSSGNSAVPVVRNIVVNDLPIAAQETFIIRNGDTIIWQGSVPLPNSGTVSINDSNGTAHTIDAQSVLALLYLIDQSSDAFAITNLQYYDSFNSFYLKCILPASGIELCDNWQYAVGNITPTVSIDANILVGEQTVGIFFGSPHRLNFDSSNMNVNTDLLVKTENYNYLNNNWDPLVGVSVGVTLPNPADPWNPTIVSTHLVDASGSVNLIFSEPNTYSLGIVEDFYFPSYEIIVSVPTIPIPASGGNSSSPDQSKKYFNVDLALTYLKSVQAENGSFGGGQMYSDWAAIAYGAANVAGSSRDSLLTYLKNNANLSTLLTDNERRAMALLALGENPYNFQGLNYIEAIIKEFDGQQFGDKGLVNDDIFALIPLLRAGYNQEDDIINQTVIYILANQELDGSWGKSLDLSAAAIQALKPISSHYEAIAPALVRAEQYIISKQNDDGGFSSVYSTSWATQAMAALDKNWTKNNNTPQDYLGVNQAADGAAIAAAELIASRIWATSYAIPAALGKDWNSILKSVAKPVIEQPVMIGPILAEEKVLENIVLGVKEVVPKKLNKLSLLVGDSLENNDTNLADENNLLTTSSTTSTAEKGNNNLTEEKFNFKDNFLSFILGVCVTLGGMFLFRFLGNKKT